MEVDYRNQDKHSHHSTPNKLIDLIRSLKSLICIRVCPNVYLCRKLEIVRNHNCKWIAKYSEKEAIIIQCMHNDHY